MYNSPQSITPDNFDKILRVFLLEKTDEAEIQKMFDLQAEVVFSGNETAESLLPSEKEIIEKLAKEKGYISPSSGNRGLFTWILSSLFILAMFTFLFKLFTISDSKGIAVHVKRHDFSIIPSIHTVSKKNSILLLPATSLPIINKKQTLSKPILKNPIISSEPNYSNNNFPFKCPQIVYGRGKSNGIYLNLDFEVKAPNTNLPDVWYAGDGGKIGENIYTVKIDSSVKYSGKYSIMFQRNQKRPNNEVFGCLTNSIPKEYFKGKDSVEITAYIKTENVQGGFAALWCNEWNNVSRKPLGYTNSNLQGGKGSSDWKKYTITLPIDTNAMFINFGGYLSNTGTAWFDKFEVSFDGEQIKDISPVIKSPEAGEIDWLDKNCLPIKTLDVGNGFNDLDKLKDIIGDARIVALGGSSYGSSEELKMKQRITEYLVSEKNFNAICLDAGMFDVSLLNTYIQTGVGNPSAILDSMHSLNLNCKEMYNTIEWIRDINRNKNPMLSLYGVGMQHSNAWQPITDFAIKNDKKLLAEILKYQKKYAEIKEKIKAYHSEYGGINVLQTKKLTKEIIPFMDKVCSRFESNKEKNLKNTTTDEFLWLENLLVELRQSLTQSLTSENYYNKYCFENIKWLLHKKPDAKIILWFINTTIDKENTGLSTGTLLYDEFKDNYVSMAFTTDSGTYTAYKDSVLCINPVLLPIKGSYEDYFRQCKYPDFIVDLRKTSITEPTGKWLDNEMWFRRLWNFYNDRQFFRGKIAGNYDAIVFLRNTNHSECFELGKKFKLFQ